MLVICNMYFILFKFYFFAWVTKQNVKKNLGKSKTKFHQEELGEVGVVGLGVRKTQARHIRGLTPHDT